MFWKLATDRQLIPRTIPVSKEDVRNELRRQGQEDAWTELQGIAYGDQILGAVPFPGSLDFIRRATASGFDLHIISHKTKRPYRGPEFDLHASARNWLSHFGVCGPGGLIAWSQVHFEENRTDKLSRIAQQCCTHFVDDLVDILADDQFPPAVEPILFDPLNRNASNCLRRVQSWRELSLLFEEQLSK